MLFQYDSHLTPLKKPRFDLWRLVSGQLQIASNDLLDHVFDDDEVLSSDSIDNDISRKV